MSKVSKVLVVVFLFLLVVSSCYKENFSVNFIHPQAFITQSGQMGISFYVQAVLPKEGTKCEITSPDGVLTWTVNLKNVRKDAVSYYGSSDIMMPDLNVLPCGTYSYVIICKDGRTSEGTFNIQYDATDVLERTSATEKPFYDELSHLTVIF